MTPYYVDDSVTLHHGDCLEVMAGLSDASIDAVVTDPPYGLEFMGKDWDAFKPSNAKIRTRVDLRTTGAEKSVVSTPEAYRAGLPFQQWCERWASECLRVLKPGGHLLSFGGSRTWHRLAAAIEDAGFEIRDSIAWIYGSGFPKSLDVSKAIDKGAGADREVVGTRKVGRGSLGNRSRVQQGYRPTELNPEGDVTFTAPATDAAKQWRGWGTALKPAFEPIVVARKPLSGTVAGNVIEHGTGALNIDACRVAHVSDADLAESQSKNRHADFGSGARENRVYGGDDRTRASQGNYDGAAGRWPANVVLDEHQAAELDGLSGITRDGTAVQRNGGGQRIFGHGDGLTRPDQGYGGGGGASRFFPVFRYEAKAPASERPTADGVAHPTVKPLDLMRWLVRLVTPPGGLVLDPFAGSGTTAEACVHEHMRCITIERETEYLPLIVARLTKPMAVGFDFGAGAT